MTTEEHVVTAETHLRYAEGHLQPSEEHLADAEVHLKLVKAHLAALEVVEPAETGSPEAAVSPPPEPTSGEASAGRAEMAPEERNRSPAARPRARSAQRGRKTGEGAPHPGAGEDWTCPVGECQDSAAHPLDECEEFKGLSVTQRRKAIKEWDRCECCRDRKTGTRCYRRIGFRRHHLLRLAAQPRANPAGTAGASSSNLRGRSIGQAEIPPWETRPGQRRTRLRPRGPAAEAGGYVVLPCSGQEQRASVAQSHQKSALGRDENHAPGSDTAGTHAECH
jgi:hypothetical protein